MIVAAEAAAGAKHHAAYHRVFAMPRWSLDELGLSALGHALSLNGDGPVPLDLNLIHDSMTHAPPDVTVGVAGRV